MQDLQAMVQSAIKSKDARSHELDFEKIQELHVLLDTKGDKTDVMQKVDKTDLKKA